MFEKSMARAIMLRNRPHRTRQDRFVGDDQGLSTTRNTSSLNHSNNSQPLNPKPPAQTHTSIGMYSIVSIKFAKSVLVLTPNSANSLTPFAVPNTCLPKACPCAISSESSWLLSLNPLVTLCAILLASDPPNLIPTPPACPKRCGTSTNSNLLARADAPFPNGYTIDPRLKNSSPANAAFPSDTAS